jgi:hypothetical protein
VKDLDDRSWESTLRPRDPMTADELRDGLELCFARPASARAVLVLTGHNTTWAAYLVGRMVQAHGSEEPAWQREAEAHPAETRAAMQTILSDGMLHVSLEGLNGWEPAGIFGRQVPVTKRQALAIDLSRVSAHRAHA